MDKLVSNRDVHAPAAPGASGTRQLLFAMNLPRFVKPTFASGVKMAWMVLWGSLVVFDLKEGLLPATAGGVALTTPTQAASLMSSAVRLSISGHGSC